MSELKQKVIKLIAVYARVSTARQEEEQTVQNQLSAVRKYAKEKGYTIVEEYVDDGWSGDMLARPALDKLRQDAKSKKWDAVLIYDPDRLARRYSYQALVSEEIEEKGIELMYITVDSPKNSEDKIFHGMRGLFAEYERAKIAERFRLGKLRKIEEGHVLMSEPPYGYNYIPKKDKTHGYIEVNPEEARVVRMIFSWVANEYMTLRTVVRKLKDLGIKPRKSKRGVWSTSTLSTLLRNETYIGRARWGSSEAIVPEKPLKITKYKRMKKSSRRIRPEKDWKYVDVPALIDKELFDKTRAQLERNYAQCKRNKKNDYLLGGLIYCTCGRRRTGEGIAGGKHLYYRCTDRVLSYPLPRKCFEKGINARISDKLVWEKLSKLMTSPELLKKQSERFLNNRQEKAKDKVGDLELIEKDIKKLKDEEIRYNKAYGTGVFTLEALREYTTPLRERLSILEKQIEQINQEKSQIPTNNIPNEKEIGKFAERSAFVLKRLSFNKKRDIALRAIEKVEGTQSHLQVYGKIPVKSYVEYQTINRYCWTAKCWEINAF